MEVTGDPGEHMRELHREMPGVMKELHLLEFDYAHGRGMDFEPYPEFLGEEETRKWIRAWTGNRSLDGAEYRVFGQDGTGGYATFWCVRPDVGVLEQPIVYFDSEGALGVLAYDFWDYLWLLAGGFGPYEALAHADEERAPHAEFTAFANTHAAANKSTPAQVLARARAAFPDFEASIRALCR
jgi:hypothetical protein